jgi:hypothetical protein
MILFTAFAAYGLFDTRIEISKPFLSVNDRIISEDEFQKMLKRKPAYMTQEQFIDSVIEKQLLIQEAVKLKINKEENFRSSVENFYEQSLIKILIDRKLDSLVVDVTNEELAKYEEYLQKKLVITKLHYPSLNDYEKRTNETIETIESDFVDLSDDLKFIVLDLYIGDASDPHATDFGVIIYRLDKVQKSKIKGKQPEFDIKHVSLFIEDKKKEQILSAWTAKIRENSEIWRKDD